MRMGKRIMAILCCILLVASLLIGCEKKTSEGTSTGNSSQSDKGAASGSNSETTTQKKKVVYWTHQRHDMEVIQELINKFMEINKDIEVEMVVNTDDYTNVLNLAYQNDQAPDIHTGGPPLKDMVDMGRYEPLDNLMSPEVRAKNEKYFVEGVNMIDGKVYSLPHVGYNFRLVYNKDLFNAAGLDPNKPPKTWQEVIDYAKQITEYGKTQNPPKYGFCLPTAETWIWWQYADQLGRVAGIQEFDYKTLQYNYEAQKPILEFYLTMQRDGSLFPGGLELKNDPARAQFSEGNIGMMIAASWDVGVFNDQFPAKCDWGVAPLPTPDGVVRGKGEFSGGTYLFINSKSKVKQEAMKLFEFLISDDSLTTYYEKGKGLPIRPEIAANCKNPPTIKGFADFADTSTDAIYPPQPPGITVEGDDRGTVYNNIMAGKVDIDKALADLDKRMNAAVKAAIDEGQFDPKKYTIPNFDPMNPTGK